MTVLAEPPPLTDNGTYDEVPDDDRMVTIRVSYLPAALRALPATVEA